VIIRQGDPGDTLGVLLSGNADVHCDGRRIGSLSPGSHFGEMALIDGEERSATITATSDLELLLVSADDFDALLKIPEVSRALLRAMSARLREMQRLPQV
jgi:CRP/FNR family cyclic AMP-dependent transcriptional regulator